MHAHGLNFSLHIATWKNQFRMRELDETGKLQNCARLTDAGFKLGDHVMRKKDSTAGTIARMTPTHVTLDVAGEGLKTCSAESFLNGDWKVMDVKAAPEMLDDFREKSAPLTQAPCSTLSSPTMKNMWFPTKLSSMTIVCRVVLFGFPCLLLLAFLLETFLHFHWFSFSGPFRSDVALVAVCWFFPSFFASLLQFCIFLCVWMNQLPAGQAVRMIDYTWLVEL